MCLCVYGSSQSNEKTIVQIAFNTLTINQLQVAMNHEYLSLPSSRLPFRLAPSLSPSPSRSSFCAMQLAWRVKCISLCLHDLSLTLLTGRNISLHLSLNSLLIGVCAFFKFFLFLFRLLLLLLLLLYNYLVVNCLVCIPIILEQCFDYLNTPLHIHIYGYINRYTTRLDI